MGTTAPNPMVGCVIVHNKKIIGEGFTSPFGGPHAEVNAMASVNNKELLKESTLYVTLEPCSHFGKTPPCSNAIVKHGIPTIVIGVLDDNPQVSGKGIAKLKSAGCDVIVGIMEKECREHHKRFFTFHNKKRPYVILKWAETKDGFVAPQTKAEKKPVWITNELSRQRVHKWRAEEQAILVGTTTVLEDNPSLTVRDWNGNNPIRVVLDKSTKLSKDFNVFDNNATTIVISENTINWTAKEHIAQQICQILYQHQINSVIIEGGTKTLQTFIDENLWDEAKVFIGDVSFDEGLKAPKLNHTIYAEEKIESDTLRTYFND